MHNHETTSYILHYTTLNNATKHISYVSKITVFTEMTIIFNFCYSCIKIIIKCNIKSLMIKCTIVQVNQTNNANFYRSILGECACAYAGYCAYAINPFC